MDSLVLQNITYSYKYLLFTSIFLLLFFSIKANADYNGELSERKINFNNLYTEQAVFSFFVGFGGVGYVLSRFLKYNVWLTLILSCLVGLVFMFFYSFLISKVQIKDRKQEAELLELVNKEGINKRFLYPHSDGKIELLIDGQVVLKNVVNNSGEEIKEEEQIKIVKMEKGVLFVERV